MNGFPENLYELMREKSVDAKTLADALGVYGSSIVYQWLKGNKMPLLTTAVKIADYFQCSLDYLFGRSSDTGNKSFNTCPAFDMQFKKVLDELKVSQYRLLKHKIVTGGNIDSWLNKKNTPTMEKLIKIADYLDVSLDYLVGRER